MTFNDTDLYCQILGSIMKDPSVLGSLPMPIAIDDFSTENQIARVVFFSLSNLIDSGVVSVNAVTIEAYLQGYPSFLQTYNRNNGRQFVLMCLDKGQPENFMAFYSRLKKISLLRDLREHGYDISPYDFESASPGSRQEFECIQRYEEATEDDILAYVEKSFASIRSKHTHGTGGYINAADGLEELLEELTRSPEIGPELNGAYYNSIVGGALRGRMYLRSGGTNVGKAIPNYTKIPLFDGSWKRVDEIKVGDTLIGSNGLPTKVLKIHPQLNKKEIYKVTFLDGHVAECCEDHLWSYYFDSHGIQKMRTETTKEILARGLTRNPRGYKFSIPMVSEVAYTEKELKIPPYIMGLLLGDGSFRYDNTNKSFSFSSKNDELPQIIAKTMGYEYVKNSAKNYSYSFNYKDNNHSHTKVWVEEILSAYPELWNKTSEEKFIPEPYLSGSPSQRWELLRGLMDTNGSISKNSANITYFTVSPKLKEQVEQLARSLGLGVSILEDKYAQYSTGVCYRLTLWCPTNKLNKMFNLSYKKKLAEEHMNNTIKFRHMDKMSIIDITPTGIYTEMTCFTVDAKDALFCMNDYTITHNTRWAVFDACSIVFPIKYDESKASWVWIKDKQPQKVLFITTEMTAKEIQTIILAYVSGVEEQHIKRNACTPEELVRVKLGIKVMEKYNEYFILEMIENPNLSNVQSTIKKHILLNDVGYVFYDYIFTSPALISQFSSSGIREDVALGLLSNQLKEIAANYNVFVATSTQVNGDGLKAGEKRDQRALRGSKAIADLIILNL